MSRSFGSVDFSELEAFGEKFNRLAESDFEKFVEDVAKELTARLLGFVIPRTPVGQYPASSGKKGGTLRRGWTSNGDEEVSVQQFVESVNIEKTSASFIVSIENPVPYASYVNDGHRTRLRKDGTRGWVEGQFFLELSIADLEKITPQLLNQRLEEFLKGALG